MEVKMDTSGKKNRGGQLGNTNALKHGFYGTVFKPGEIRRLDKVGKSELRGEIALLRVLINRALVSMEGSDLGLSDDLKALRVITFAVSCVEKLERTNKFIFDQNMTLDTTIEETLDSCLENWKLA
jgi:hypothetical protein